MHVLYVYVHFACPSKFRALISIFNKSICLECTVVGAYNIVVFSVTACSFKVISRQYKVIYKNYEINFISIYSAYLLT